MAEITVKNVISYIIGNLRYKCYYSNHLSFLIREHILEQIEWRIEVMDRECYSTGSCKLCGCSTTALQMANKACNKPCYPAMINKKQWNKFKKTSSYELVR